MLRLRALVLTLLVCWIGAAGVSGPTYASSSRSAQTLTGEEAASTIQFHGLEAVDALSPTEVWAVGSRTLREGVTGTLTQHWDGTSWTNVRAPSPGASFSILSAVDAIAPDDVWAVGYARDSSSGPQSTLIEHWDGSNWTMVPRPDHAPDGDMLTSVAAVSATDVWAAGTTVAAGDSAESTLVEHWNGTGWTVVSSPDQPGAEFSFLEGLTAVSPTNIWAVGSSITGERLNATLVEHWNGQKWRVVGSADPYPKGNLLYGVSAVSARDVWTVGYTLNPPYGTIVEHWNGDGWASVDAPNPGVINQLRAVSAVSRTDAWAVGLTHVVGRHPARTLIDHWDGATWSEVSGDTGSRHPLLSGVSAISATDAWTVGQEWQGDKQDALIEHWDGADWTAG